MSQSKTGWKRWQRERLSRVVKEDLVTLEQVKELSRLEVLSILLQEKAAMPRVETLGYYLPSLRD